MELTKEFSEVIGMFAADGCMQKEYICMWGSIFEDKDYYDNIVCPFYSKILKKEIKAHEKKSNSVYGFYICDKTLIKLFKELGFKNKKTYEVDIPLIIKENNNEEIITAFIRGFSDCDGSIYFQKRKGNYNLFKKTFHTYPKIEIDSVSEKIIKNISLLLNKLKIDHKINITKSRKSNESDKYRIMIRGSKRIENFMEKIGFNNFSKKSKYLIWKKFGFCPIKTTIDQRKQILEGVINPKDFYKL